MGGGDVSALGLGGGGAEVSILAPPGSSCGARESACGPCGGLPGDGGGTPPGDGGGVFPPATGPIDIIMPMAEAPLPDWFDGGPAIDLRTGSLRYSLAGPPGSAFDANPAFTYTSRRASKTSDNGYGVTGLFNARLTESGNNADLLTGTACLLSFTDKNASGLYDAPPGSQLKLVKNADNTWTATTPANDKLHFDTSGKLDYLANPANSLWTVTYFCKGQPPVPVLLPALCARQGASLGSSAELRMAA
jgi:hypothetical protein